MNRRLHNDAVSTYQCNLRPGLCAFRPMQDTALLEIARISYLTGIVSQRGVGFVPQRPALHPHRGIYPRTSASISIALSQPRRYSRHWDSRQQFQHARLSRYKKTSSQTVGRAWGTTPKQDESRCQSLGGAFSVLRCARQGRKRGTSCGACSLSSA